MILVISNTPVDPAVLSLIYPTQVNEWAISIAEEYIYQKEACKQMSRKLTRQRVLILYADKDYEEIIGIGDCFDKFLTTKFRIHET